MRPAAITVRNRLTAKRNVLAELVFSLATKTKRKGMKERWIIKEAKGLPLGVQVINFKEAKGMILLIRPEAQPMVITERRLKDPITA